MAFSQDLLAACKETSLRSIELKVVDQGAKEMLFALEKAISTGKAYVHPSFRYVASQLTEDDCLILKYFYEIGERQPVFSCRTMRTMGLGEFDSLRDVSQTSLPMVVVNEDGNAKAFVMEQSDPSYEGVTILKHLSLLGEKTHCEQSKLSEFYIVNMIRLGLLEEGVELAVQSLYEEMAFSAAIIEKISKRASELFAGKRTIVCYEKESVRLTDYGRMLCAACFGVSRDGQA